MARVDRLIDTQMLQPGTHPIMEAKTNPLAAEEERTPLGRGAEEELVWVEAAPLGWLTHACVQLHLVSSMALLKQRWLWGSQGPDRVAGTVLLGSWSICENINLWDVHLILCLRLW
jgi:hypothetical protein